MARLLVEYAELRRIYHGVVMSNFNRRCDGVSRRAFIQLGALTALGVTAWGAPRASSGALLSTEATGSGPRRDAAARGFGQARHCILIWLDGGPSHLETFDPKPEAASEIRGPFSAIPTTIPGVQVNECLPRLAQSMQDWTFIRSMTSPLGEHNLATRYLLTGQRPSPAIHYPVMGSVVGSLERGTGELPRFIAIPHHRVGGEAFPSEGYLPARHRPFETGGDPKQPQFDVHDLRFYPGLDAERLQRRAAFLKRLNALQDQLQHSEGHPSDPWERAIALATSPSARAAFSLEQEVESLRQAYGMTTVGQGCLLARRLVERGVPYVTVNFPGWDTHDASILRLKEGYTGAQVPAGLIPQLDGALAGLIADLKRTGLLSETLVVVMGEFGRTPKMNATGGRDHWPRAFSVALAGGGVAGGQVIGATDRHGQSPVERPITPADLAATIYWMLGIDPRTTLQSEDGRPIQLVVNGSLIEELVGT